MNCVQIYKEFLQLNKETNNPIRYLQNLTKISENRAPGWLGYWTTDSQFSLQSHGLWDQAWGGLHAQCKVCLALSVPLHTSPQKMYR